MAHSARYTNSWVIDGQRHRDLLLAQMPSARPGRCVGSL